MAMESSFVQPFVLKFDGYNDHWAMLMENFLRSKEYWSGGNRNTYRNRRCCRDGITKEDIEDQKLKDLKENNNLFQALDCTVLETILNKETSKSIWDSMRKENLSTSVFARTLTIVNKMKANGESKGDGDMVARILRSMTQNFNYVVCAIEEAKDTSLLSIDELQSSLLVHEQHRGHYRGGFRGRGRGRGKQTFDKSTVEFFKCHKLVHFQWECSAKEVNYVESRGEMMLMAYVDVDAPIKPDTWFLDSGCSNHMCGNIDHFTYIDENFSDTLKLGDNTSMVVAGKGSVRLKVNDVHEKCKVYHPERGLFLEIKKSTNKMFIFSAVYQPLASICFGAITEDLVQLWHLNFKGLKTLQQKEMVNGLPQLMPPTKLYRETTLEQTRDRTTSNIDDAENYDSDSSVEEGSTSSGEARRRAPPVWMQEYVTGDGLSEGDDEAYFLMFATMDSIRFEDIVENEKWKHAMDVEMEAIKRNGTWELVDLPEGSKKGVKWIYKTKYDENGEVNKYKARLVVKGYAQEYGIYYNEVFAPVARMETIHLVLALAAKK
ncbi:UNVERIFIED_CONTAM: Retrovirus-related Pol polyprotein from transposon RE1 [Sesamum radiatum]|uniref:Retrovirus-related Pol polyprotein from transposon RE1 n=1 Tax=Sesamum radiatum TaxID=300843 RepID=A0AAW2V7I3_SESRA